MPADHEIPPGGRGVSAKPKSPVLLTINGGSSSIKFGLFTCAEPPRRIFAGQIERIGEAGTRLVAAREGAAETAQAIDAADHRQAAVRLIAFLEGELGEAAIVGIGHRVVHGGVHLLAHQVVTPELVTELRRNQPLDLAHLPREIALIEAFGEAFPKVVQAACFDTAFHREMPRVAQLLPIPRQYDAAGVRRFGFHGLSYTYLMHRLGELSPESVQGRVLLAHLGSGASMAAVRRGKPMETTMGFTPTAGLVMGTRPGDLDPGLLVYMMREQWMTPGQMDDFISRRCGLAGVSETSSDMRDLLARRGTDVRAAEAVDLFSYHARKHMGALAAAMGGLDTVVFSGGIGEHASEVRAEICAGLEFLGLWLDSAANQAGGAIISRPDSRVQVRVIATDEELIIAQATFNLLPRN